MFLKHTLQKGPRRVWGHSRAVTSYSRRASQPLWCTIQPLLLFLLLESRKHFIGGLSFHHQNYKQFRPAGFCSQPSRHHPDFHTAARGFVTPTNINQRAWREPPQHVVCWQQLSIPHHTFREKEGKHCSLFPYIGKHSNTDPSVRNWNQTEPPWHTDQWWHCGLTLAAQAACWMSALLLPRDSRAPRATKNTSGWWVDWGGGGGDNEAHSVQLQKQGWGVKSLMMGFLFLVCLLLRHKYLPKGATHSGI